jgi:hypothetical protein
MCGLPAVCTLPISRSFENVMSMLKEDWPEHLGVCQRKIELKRMVGEAKAQGESMILLNGCHIYRKQVSTVTLRSTNSTLLQA